MIRDTSLKAYINEVSPTLGARQVAVLEVFEAKNGADLTNEELGQALGWAINRVTPRVFELRTLGIVEDAGKRRCSVTGREVHSWRVKSKPAVSPRAISTAPTLYQMPSVSEPGKTHTITATPEGRTVMDGVKCDCKGFLYRGSCSHLAKLMNRVPKPEETMTPLFG